jgi:hypothetical protein
MGEIVKYYKRVTMEKIQVLYCRSLTPLIRKIQG